MYFNKNVIENYVNSKDVFVKVKLKSKYLPTI